MYMHISEIMFHVTQLDAINVALSGLSLYTRGTVVKSPNGKSPTDILQ